MLQREIQPLPPHIYPADEWSLVEKQFHPAYLARMETLFSTGNGFLGIRGCFEEGTPVFQRGTFINGFHETWPIIHAEEAYGFARTGQTMVNATDSAIIRLYVDDEPFELSSASLISFKRALDMRAGTLDRTVVWETPTGNRVSVRSRRLVSFRHRHLAAISYRVTLLNSSASLVISSEAVYQPAVQEVTENDPRVRRTLNHRILQPALHQAGESRFLLGHVTSNSGMSMVCGLDHIVETSCPFSTECRASEDSGRFLLTANAKEGQSVSLTKFMTYHTSNDSPIEELGDRAGRSLDHAKTSRFEGVLQNQREELDAFWDRSDVQVRGDEAMQQVIRFNLFHVWQAAARAESAGVPAKGLTGHGYEGHYFWDAEIYLLPFFIYSTPRVARNLLKFRHGMLAQARQRAREMSQRGGLFPWRTINGEEASAYYAAGTAQYHINADVIYGLKKYVEVTGDTEFLYNEGVEMLVETARLWVDLGFFSERKGGRFCINGVTGPDEYNTVVNNNTFTNLMARENLWYAAQTVGWLRKNKPDRYTSLVHDTGLEASELDAWKKAADAMYVPMDEKARIHLQDDGFLDKEVWDFANTPPEEYPLLLHHHPLVIYRHQVIKQADVVLAMFLLGNEFSEEQKKRNFDYYDPLTTGDSSLSVSVQSIVAYELGYVEKAREYAHYALLMDLADIAENVDHGCHIASMGGTWMAVVYGIAGMRDYEGRITFDPRIPKRGVGARLTLTIRGQKLVLDLDKEKSSITYLLEEGSHLTIYHERDEIRLLHGQPVTRKVTKH